MVPEVQGRFFRIFSLRKRSLRVFEKKNNILLPLDLCNYVFRYLGSEAFQHLGENSVSLLAETEYGQLLAQSPNLQFMLEYFFFEIVPVYVEKNFKWTIVDSKHIPLSSPGNLAIL